MKTFLIVAASSDGDRFTNLSFIDDHISKSVVPKRDFNRIKFMLAATSEKISVHSRLQAKMMSL